MRPPGPWHRAVDRDNLPVQVRAHERPWFQHRKLHGTFTHDSLSRLLTATNPEAGTTTYTYDPNGNVTRKQDARGIQVNFTYDALNRPLSKGASDSTFSVTFAYDTSGVTGAKNTIGRLTSESVTGGGTITRSSPYAYDPMGRVTAMRQCTPVNCTPYVPYTMTFAYDLAGNLVSSTNGITNPGILLTSSYDAAGRLKTLSSSWSDASHPGTLFSAVAYGPIGLGQAHLGLNASNPPTINLTQAYDNRGRLVSRSSVNASSQPVYSFSVPAPAANTGFAPNGNLLSFSDSVMGSWALQYDNLNRLNAGTVNSGTYNKLNLSWTYDNFGNRTAQSVLVAPTAPVPGSSWAHYNGSNRVSSTNTIPAGLVYDAAGNVLNDGVNQYVYDAESRLCAVKNLNGSLFGYINDAEGRRVAKGTLTTLSCVPGANGFVATNGYLLGLNGEQVSETDGKGNWLHTNVFANGGLLATYRDTNTYFALNDWLGNKRAQYTAAGGLTTYATLPFGDNLTAAGSGPDATEHHFTGKERDTESRLDYFGARMYASTIGRFMSPDPSGIAFASAANPQSLNLYSYALNNPLRFIDPTGLTACFYGGEGDTPQNDHDATDYEDVISQKECEDNGGVALVDNQTVNVHANGDSGNYLSLLDGGGSSIFIQFIPGKACSAALTTAGQNSQAIGRYYQNYRAPVGNAASANGISANFLAAVGVRESGMQNIAQPNGQGRGVFQIDLGAHPGVSEAQAFDVNFSANFAANMLSANQTQLAQDHPNLDPAHLAQATAASYNFGTKNISGNPNTIDVKTTGENYGSNVMAISGDCF